MERKFESELGRRVAEEGRKKFPRKVAVLAVTLSACALMMSSAAFLLPAIAGEGEEVGKPVYWNDVITAQNDYLVYEDGAIVHYTEEQWTDQVLFDVKRTVTLKAAAFDAPSEFSTAQYNKYVYSVNINLRDLSQFTPGGVVVGEVAIPYTGTTTPVVSWTMTDDGLLVASSDEVPPAWAPADVTAADKMITMTVSLPSGYVYTVGSQISIQIMVKVPLYTEVPWSLEIDEDAFRDFDDLEILP